MKDSFVSKMAEAGPEALEMPEDISETGMMMGLFMKNKPIFLKKPLIWI